MQSNLQQTSNKYNNERYNPNNKTQPNNETFNSNDKIYKH